MSNFYAARQIIPNLWIGSAGNGDGARPTAAKWQQAHNIQLVINCTKDIVFANAGATEFRIPVDDAEYENDAIIPHWRVLMPIIREHLFFKKPVLVHCYAGIQRSAATVAAYLMYDTYEHNKRTNRPPAPMKPIDALRFVKSKKPETFQNKPTFLKALKKYYTVLRT